MDIERGFTRTDINVFGQNPEVISIHTLDRYDMEASYTIDNEHWKCTTTSRKNQQLENPFTWVLNSSFAGETSYRGQDLQVWEFVSASTYKSVAVKKGTNEPVIIVTRELSHNGTVSSEMTLIVAEWNLKSSPQWMRYIPQYCIDENNVGDANGVVYFANNNWNCADPACDQTVPVGSGQPNYGCAEFVARCIAYGGYFPGLAATAPQGNYYSYAYGGNTYDLCLCSSLSDALGALGFSKLAAAYSSVDAGVATFGDGGDGYFSHAVIGVAPQVVDAHNNARLQIGVSDDLFNGVDGAWGLPGSPPTTGSTTGSYYSTQAELSQQGDAIFQGGSGAKGDSEQLTLFTEADGVKKSDTPIRVVEEKAMRKFQ